VVSIENVKFDFENMYAYASYGEGIHKIKWDNNEGMLLFENSLGDWWPIGIAQADKAYESWIVDNILLD